MTQELNLRMRRTILNICSITSHLVQVLFLFSLLLGETPVFVGAQDVASSQSGGGTDKERNSSSKGGEPPVQDSMGKIGWLLEGWLEKRVYDSALTPLISKLFLLPTNA
eukprot:CAMPEP_0185737746 /NCGR_PEP_ID=MMETSP1171-20130828/31180_1 /TAXON_ID=374046 /ORGANISM="Helicotheca tamensis, Strain CCMP826" /LENGTH=108 /DNA_ID=CAMNT_0028408749 /DNA_START=102 /DNA_END=424 /DNA_ORIENTATION=+